MSIIVTLPQKSDIVIVESFSPDSETLLTLSRLHGAAQNRMIK